VISAGFFARWSHLRVFFIHCTRENIMAKAKLVLTASPTFKAKVAIPVPGNSPTLVEFTFKGRTKDQFKEFIDALRDRDDVDVVLDVASGWELEDAFDREAIEQLTQNYIGSARAIIEKYLSELTQARLGN
jgi:Phage tail assembly chaperone